MELSRSIPLPFTPESVRTVLQWGARPEAAPYTHKQIAQWCDQFWCEYMDVDAPPVIKRLLPVLADVDAQWDLYLANTFSLDELRSRSLDDVNLPAGWFEDWLKEAFQD